MIWASAQWIIKLTPADENLPGTAVVLMFLSSFFANKNSRFPQTRSQNLTNWDTLSAWIQTLFSMWCVTDF